MLLPMGASVKSIQRGVIQIDGTSVSNTATINSVTTTKSIVNFCGVRTDSNTQYCAHCYLTLTNATTVTAYRNNASSANSWVSYEVVEFE